jgi:tyrosinase
MSWSAGGGNRAHRGPIFLPWHRLYLRRLEEAVQIVSGDDDFALPYWDWSDDGQASPSNQPHAAIWSLVGAARGRVTQGPLAEFRVRLFQSTADGRLYVGSPRPIWRDAARGMPTLPDRTDRAWTLADGLYDVSPWDEGSDSFRNKLEGFQDPREPEAPRPAPWMHNRVHVWIGGEMASGTSPNDPVFWLNHCNVDRLWEAWMRRRGRTYLPGAGQGLSGHRANDPMFSIVWPSMTPSQVLTTESGLDWYPYDLLPS